MCVLLEVPLVLRPTKKLYSMAALSGVLLLLQAMEVHRMMAFVLGRLLVTTQTISGEGLIDPLPRSPVAKPVLLAELHVFLLPSSDIASFERRSR